MSTSKPSVKRNTVQHIIHVDGHQIRSNKRNNTNDPTIVLRRGRSGKGSRLQKVTIVDKEGNPVAYVVHKRNRPLSCGAVVYVECIYEPPEANAFQSTVGDACSTGLTP